MDQQVAETMVDRLEGLENEGKEIIRFETSFEHLKTLLAQEAERYPVCADYLALGGDSQAVPVPSDRVSEAWRRKLVEWCFEVVDHFNFDREVVSFAVDYLDRIVAIKTKIAKEALPKREFQLLAVTSLYMAIKIHGETDEKEGPRRKLRISAFVELSRGFFAVDVIEAMERQLLDSICWRVNPPTCLRFIATFLPLCPKWQAGKAPHSTVVGGIYDVARYLTELSVCVSSFAFNSTPSITAYASVLCSLEALKSTLPVPEDKLVIFLNNMEAATGLSAAHPQVFTVCNKLKELCPSMFEGEDSSLPDFLAESTSNLSIHGPTDGKVSPVSVMNPPMESSESPRTRSHRKRTRAAADEPSRPYHRSS